MSPLLRSVRRRVPTSPRKCLPFLGSSYLRHVKSIYRVDRDAALSQWNANRTGPLTEAVGHTVMWHRLPKNSAPIKAYGDPSSGSNAPHIELFFLVCPSARSHHYLHPPHSRIAVQHPWSDVRRCRSSHDTSISRNYQAGLIQSIRQTPHRPGLPHSPFRHRCPQGGYPHHETILLASRLGELHLDPRCTNWS